MLLRLQACLALTTALTVYSASNIDPDYAWLESPSIGEIDWRPSADFGASINQYFCSGYLLGTEVGWIGLGAGTPKDGVRYRNDSATDFGVNVLQGGALRGFAYGANIGWITFEERGNPRVDWVTGKLTGEIYSANAGWISLESAEGVRVNRIADAPDADGDGLPDAWEIAQAGTTTRLSGVIDSDSDGLSDRDEFLAGTNPLDSLERLALTLSATSQSRSITWATRLGYVYRLEKRSSFQPGTPWVALNSEPIVGTGSAVSFALPADSGEPNFFRLRAYPPLSHLD